ncbi:hypothetical protein CGRA01v4_12512 [Colletotrichum graminicola]|nr:hypothetical protein CGRA01v4_12512 [Colletotrichum graminicola]
MRLLSSATRRFGSDCQNSWPNYAVCEVFRPSFDLKAGLILDC